MLCYKKTDHHMTNHMVANYININKNTLTSRKNIALSIMS